MEKNLGLTECTEKDCLQDVKPFSLFCLNFPEETLKSPKLKRKRTYSFCDEKTFSDKSSRSSKCDRKRQLKKRYKKWSKLNEVVIVDSSSASCYSLSSADSDTDGSQDSYERRRHLKKVTTERSIISSFDKLILPSINKSLKERYRSKFSNSVRSKLHFITCICTSSYNSEHFSKFEIAAIQENIEKEDNERALNFLAQQIVNVILNIEKTTKSDIISNHNMNKIPNDNNILMSAAEDWAVGHNHKRELQLEPQYNQLNGLMWENCEEQKRLNEKNYNINNCDENSLTTEGLPMQVKADERVDTNLLNATSLFNDDLNINVKKIDVKLVEIYRRQMFLNEMITKLQKDKMDANLMAVQLESKKYMLIKEILKESGIESVANTDLGKVQEISRLQKRMMAENAMERHVDKKSKLDPLYASERKENLNERENVIDKETKNKTEGNMEVNEINNETILVKRMPNNTADYSDIESGYLESIKSPVTVICTIDNYIIAGTEDGDIYQYNLRTLKSESRFKKHSNTITDICQCPKSKLIYSISLDGYLKISNIENLKIDMQSVNLQEPLQTMDIKWDMGYIGSRWGNVFTYDIEVNKINVSPLCASNASITKIKAATEGVRKVLLVSFRGNVLNIRDAETGLLLRTLHLPDHLSISSVLLDGGFIYCGSHKKKVYKFDFITGSHVATLMCGNGAVSMDIYKQRFLLVGCYDGLIYVIDTDNNKCVAHFSGSGRMVLTLKVLGDKVITSAKNKTLQIIDIPKHVVVTAMVRTTNH